MTQSNNFVTALGTNTLMSHSNMIESADTLLSHSTYFIEDDPDKPIDTLDCGVDNILVPTGISSDISYISLFQFSSWKNDTEHSKIVKGFFTGCLPFESLLQSTLDCLYEIDCLQLINDNFPSLNEMNLNLSDYILHLNRTNHTIYNYLSNLFINEWTTTLNYTAYFQTCNPSKCTYTTTTADNIDYSSAIAVFISLYGGLVLILRSISSFFINILFKFQDHSITQQKCIQWIKQLNLYKLANQRTENEIKQQKLNTYTYLILLLSMITVLIVFNSLNTQIVTTSISNPSLATYESLQQNHLDTLTCPCSTMALPYDEFMSFSPVLHQICSSDLIRDEWISTLQECATEFLAMDWRNRAYKQFRLLSQLCQLANETIRIAVNEFLLQSFVVSNAPIEKDFNLQIQKILVQFYESTFVYFHHLIDTVNLHIQVDQPFMLSFTAFMSAVNYYSVKPIESNATNNNSLVEVCTIFFYVGN